jgi:hypothetical protein
VVKISVYLGEGVIDLLFHTQLLEVLRLMHFVLNIIIGNYQEFFKYNFKYHNLGMNFTPKVLIF